MNVQAGSNSTGPSGPQRTPLSAARSTFQDALELLRNQQHPGSRLETWLKDKHTQTDVQDSIEEAKCLYEARSKSSARTWLGKLSSGILSYGKVMDMLAQHHPEYVSLAWGTTKLLFILFQHHDELVTELAKSMSEISDMLPRTNVYVEIYRTPILTAKAEHLFTLIIKHFHAMLKFYREGKLKHAWKAFIQPYHLRFKDLKDEIDQCSRSIEQYALSSLHVSVDTINKGQGLLSSRVDMIDVKLSLLLSKMCQIQAETALLPSMSISQNRLEMSDMISLASGPQLLAPTEVLRYRLAFSRRYTAHYRINFSNLWSSSHLKDWSSSAHSAAILIQGTWPSRNETNAVGTHMTDFIHQSGHPCLWALQHATESKKQRTSWIQVLKYLTMQALQQNSEAISKSLNNDFNTLVVASAIADEQWESILLQALANMDTVYLVLDLAVLDDLDPTDLDPMLRSITRLTSSASQTSQTVIKIAIIGSRKSHTRPSLPGSYRLEVDRFMKGGRRLRQAALNRRMNNAKGARMLLKTRTKKSS